MEQTTNVSPDVGQQPAPNHASEVVKRKRPRGKPSETNREEAKRILTLVGLNPRRRLGWGTLSEVNHVVEQVSIHFANTRAVTVKSTRVVPVY